MLNITYTFYSRLCFNIYYICRSLLDVSKESPSIGDLSQFKLSCLLGPLIFLLRKLSNNLAFKSFEFQLIEGRFF